MRFKNEKIFLLNSEKEFKKAEKFKEVLENLNKSPKISQYGLNAIKIRW